MQQVVSLQKMIALARQFFNKLPDKALLNTSIETLITFFEEEEGIYVMSESVFQAVRNSVAVERQHTIKSVVESLQQQSEMQELRREMARRATFDKIGF